MCPDPCSVFLTSNKSGVVDWELGLILTSCSCSVVSTLGKRRASGVTPRGSCERSCGLHGLNTAARSSDSNPLSVSFTLTTCSLWTEGQPLIRQLAIALWTFCLAFSCEREKRERRGRRERREERGEGKEKGEGEEGEKGERFLGNLNCNCAMATPTLQSNCRLRNSTSGSL